MRPDQERVSSLIASTVIKLCEKGLEFSIGVKIEGVIGVTIDANEAFVVHVNKTLFLNECVGGNPTFPSNRISSSNIQEPSSSGNRDGAISVGSSSSSRSINNTDILNMVRHNSSQPTIKEEKDPVEAYAQQQLIQPQTTNFTTPASVFIDDSWSRPNDFESANDNSKTGLNIYNKTETTDNAYDQMSSNIYCDDDDTIDFQDTSFGMKTETFHEVKPSIETGMYQPTGEDWVKGPAPGSFQKLSSPPMAKQETMSFPISTWANIAIRNPSPQTKRSASVKSTISPNVRFQPPWVGVDASAMNSPGAIPSNAMALVPVQQPRLRQQHPTLQARPRNPQQSYMQGMPQQNPVAQPRMANPGRRPKAPAAGTRMAGRGAGGRGAGGGAVSSGGGGGRGGPDVANQVVECQSGNGFTFNKQLTVLSRYSCNLCGKVYKNQRSVLHHQSQVHGRPKVPRRKKTDSLYEEDGYEPYAEEMGEEAYYDEGYGNEAW